MNPSALPIFFISSIFCFIMNSRYKSIKDLKTKGSLLLKINSSYFPSIFTIMLFFFLILSIFIPAQSYSSIISNTVDASFTFEPITGSYSCINYICLIPFIIGSYFFIILSKYAYLSCDSIFINGFQRKLKDIKVIELTKIYDRSYEHSACFYHEAIGRAYSSTIYVNKDDFENFKELIGDKCVIKYV